MTAVCFIATKYCMKDLLTHLSDGIRDHEKSEINSTMEYTLRAAVFMFLEERFSAFMNDDEATDGDKASVIDFWTYLWK